MGVFAGGFEVRTLRILAVCSSTGQSAAIELDKRTQVQAFLNVTAKASSPNLDVWIQVSPDGATWYDLGYDWESKTAAAAADVTQAIGKRNINGVSSATDVGQWTCVYRSFPTAWIRASWVFSGSGDITFEVIVTGK